MVFFILFLVNSVIVTINNIQLAKNPKLLSNKSTTDEIILTTKNAVKSKANFDLLHLMFVVLIGSIINVGVTNRSYKNNFKKSRAYLSKIR